MTRSNPMSNMGTSDKLLRFFYAAIWALTLIVYGVIFVSSQNKLIYTDEIVFAQDFNRVAGSLWKEVLIPHPPLYIFLGSLVVSLFGDGFLALRLIGGISFLLTLGLIPLACRKLFPQHWLRATIIAHLIWAFHPLSLQGSLLLDIDNTIFTPALLIFIITASLPRGKIIFIALAFALMLFSKLLPTSLFITSAVIVIGLIQRKQAARLLLGVLLGAAIFVIVLLILALMTGFPLSVVTSTFQRANDIVQTPQKLLSRLVMGGGITAVWIGIPFLAVYGLALIRRTAEILKSKRADSSDVLILTAMVGFALVTLGNELPMGFPRYHYPLFFLMVLTISGYLAELQMARKAAMVLVAFTAILMVYFVLVQPDPLLPQYQLTFETNNMMERLKFGLLSQAKGFVFPFAFALLAAMIVKTRSPFVLACLAFCAASWLVTDFAQARADYATIYEYGRVGGAATSDWVKANTAPDAIIVAPREVEWLTKRETMFVITQVGPNATADGWMAYFATKKPSAYVMTTKELQRYTQITQNPQVLKYLQTCYRQEPSISSYHMWLRTCP